MKRTIALILLSLTPGVGLAQIQIGGNVKIQAQNSNAVAPYGPFVTDPPYNAKCDGTTDDTAAIQAAIDANSAIQLPRSTSADQQQCNVTSLVQHQLVLNIYGNGSILASAITSGSMISTDDTSDSASLNVFDLYPEMDYTTGTPTMFDLRKYYNLTFTNVYDNSSAPGGFSHSYVAIEDTDGENSIVLNNTTFRGDINLTNNYGFFTMLGSQTGQVTGPIYTFVSIASYHYGNLNLDNSQTVTMLGSGLKAGSTLSIDKVGAFEGNMWGQGPSAISGTPYSGHLTYASDTFTFPVQKSWGPLTAGNVYSKASSQLAACASSNVTATAWVSDATSLTPGTAYDPAAGAGANTVQVQCVNNGTAWHWQTM